MDIYPTTKPFIYVIGWTDLNAWYLGCRYAKGCQPLDLWTTYFTSSKHVAELRDAYGEPDHYEVVFMGTADEVLTKEAGIIREFNLHHGTRWLNRGCYRTYKHAPGEASERNRKRYQKPGEREKTGAATRRRYDDPAERRKASARSKATADRPGFREGLSERSKDKWQDPEYVEKVMTARAASRDKSSAAATAQWADPDYRARRQIIDAASGPKRSAAITEKWKDPEYRAKCQAAAKERERKKAAERAAAFEVGSKKD